MVDAPGWFEPLVRGEAPFAVAGREGGGAEDEHVEAAGRGVVDPSCGEEPDGVQGGEVDLLGVDEGVGCAGAEVVDVVD